MGNAFPHVLRVSSFKRSRLFPARSTSPTRLRVLRLRIFDWFITKRDVLNAERKEMFSTPKAFYNKAQGRAAHPGLRRPKVDHKPRRGFTGEVESCRNRWSKFTSIWCFRRSLGSRFSLTGSFVIEHIAIWPVFARISIAPH